MLHKIKYQFVVICSLAVLCAKAQSVKDSSFRILMVGVHFGGQVPLGDLQKRFGENLNAGANFVWKTKRNILFGVEGSYFFGSNVKEDVLSNLRTDDGHITDNEGYPADLRVTERGWNFYANAGYLINKLGHNPNSGVFVTVGAGWTQHKVKLYDTNKKIAAINGDLKKGYDRLTGGFGLSQFIGYKYMGNTRLVNFYAGFEFYEAFTKSLRGYNFDTGLFDNKQRMDILVGFRFGWILPLYKRTKDMYYY